MNAATKTGLDTAKTAFKKVVSVEATGEFIRNIIAEKIVKQKPMLDANSRKKYSAIENRQNTERIKKYYKIVLYFKISKSLDDLTVKVCDKKMD